MVLGTSPISIAPYLKGFDFQLSYHPGKANVVVVDALSRKMLHMSALMVKELELIEQF